MGCSFRGSGRSSGFSTAREDGREEIREIVGAAPERGKGEPAAEDREHSENDQRAEHAPRRFVHVDMVLVVALVTVEGQENQAEHVERGEERGEQADGIERLAAGNHVRAEEDLVLAEEAGKERAPEMARVAMSMVQ